MTNDLVLFNASAQTTSHCDARPAGRRTTRNRSRQHGAAWLRNGVVIVAIAVLPATTWGATAAYWRHEEGPAGSNVPDGPATVLDSSGNGNHMKTFSSAAAPFTAATYVSTVSPLALRSGLPNTLALDFGPNPAEGTDDGGGRNDDNYTDNSIAPITTQLFTEMTVELAFNLNSLEGFQSLVGRDGKPLGDEVGEPDSPVAPFQIKVRGDDFPDAIPNQLFVEWIDGDGDIHFLSSGESMTTGVWNHVAFTLTATAAELWIAGETGDYVLKDAISGEDFAGELGPGEVIIFDPTPFTVGRGMFNNGVTDWSDAIIDEVRISDQALLPTEFLFETVPATDNADFDGMNGVDGRDFLAWQRGFGINDGSATLADGDANGDGNVDDVDLAIWESQFGSPAGVINQASVPEPASLALLGVVAVAWGWRRLRNQRFA
ncbi:MAG: PEP-CTERM sorting domain-containing protein [Planctomycetales bacterium]|nr:PEP-CTERM sorting domain-containing protein [Planctomycetales bacterium]